LRNRQAKAKANTEKERERASVLLKKMSKEVSEEGQRHGKDYVDPPPAPLLDLAELKLWSFYRSLIAEFIATLLFLYVTVATVIGHKKATATGPCDGVGLLGIAWAFGGMIFVLVYCTAGISGKNPHPSPLQCLKFRKLSLFLLCSNFVAVCRWAYQPGRDVRAVLGPEGVADSCCVVHGGAVLGSHLRRWVGQGFHEARLQQAWRWS
jgi:hypothetical protein